MNEKEKIIKEFNFDNNKYGCDKLYHEEFSKMAEKYPERSAIVFNESKITYKELNEMTNSLAHYLRSKGVRRNDIIPIICDRSPFYIIGTLGISKSGGAFLPVDKNLPIDRIQFILKDVHPKLILYRSCEEVIDQLNNNDDFKNILNNLEEHNYSLNCNKINNINEPDDTCYVLFTSGTTGNPKGAAVSHFNIYNYIRKFDNKKEMKNFSIYSLFIESNNITNVLGLSNFSFDISHIEITLSLVHGLNIVLIDDKKYNDVILLSDYITKNNVELINSTPTRIKLFMENDKFKKSIKNVKAVILTGEVLSKELCKDIHKYSKTKIYNGYGPTECAVDCSFIEVDENINEMITIGRQLCNCKVYILDKNQKPVPIGVIGEIYIGGYGVGKGYLNREELTKEKFVENKYNYDNDEHNKIMYRTGDLGKWKSNGEIDYLGRIDFQVKINGQRVELGDIESKILEIQEIQQCVVIDQKKETGEKYLVCYYISKASKEEISNKSIRKYLNEKLPRYMVPNYYIKINSFPLSSTGKLNRRALPIPNKEDFITETYVAPKSKIEKVICKIFSDIFNTDELEIGKMHDFYDLGGDSLDAIRISLRIEKELNIKINIKDIMNNSMICELSKYIELILNDYDNDCNKMEIISKRNSKEFPITSQQLGVYIDSIKEINSILYNIPRFYKLNTNVDKERIKKAILKIFEKQEILRSRYAGKEINGKTEIYGFIDDECSLKFEEYSYENIGTFIRPFDLNKAPLMRVAFIGNEYLLIDIHHIICDGITDLVIMNELNKYYNNKEVEELEIQFSDYAININEKKNNGKLNEQIEIYKEIFSNEYEILNIPKTNKMINNNDLNDEIEESNRYEQLIDKTTSSIINEFIKHNNISKTALFISIYGYVLSKYSGQDVIYTSVMNMNRNNHYIENMAGMFVSTLPLLLNYNNEENRFIEIIKENMETLVNIYNNQDISFAELTEILKLKKINNSFIFQPHISYDDNENQNKSIFITDCEDENMNLFNEIKDTFNQNNKSKFEISFGVIENKDNYLISIEYDNSLYDSRMVKNILNSYIELICNIKNIGNINIKNIEYIPIKEKDRIVKEFNSDVNKEGCDKLYYEEFRKIAEKYPERNAIIFNEISITYKKLDEMSNSLAYYLRSQGVQRNDMIPIICDRSPYYIIGILGISKAGGAFLPIDKNLPTERIQLIIKDVNPKLILYKNCEEVIDNLLMEENNKYNVYDLEKHNYSLNIGEINIINETNDICYVIFTSGTTGKPKGTLVSFYNIYNFIRSNIDNNNKCSNNGFCNYDSMMKNENVMNILGITNFSFDASFVELLFSLIHGLKIILVDEITNDNINLLSNYMIKNKVEFIQITPSRLKLLIENNLFIKALHNLKSIGLAGEELSIELCKSIKEISNCKIFNEYGPTECAVGC
eukprot:jgi/Orpsp1_1/1174601/evm.model.c7180000050709.1